MVDFKNTDTIHIIPKVLEAYSKESDVEIHKNGDDAKIYEMVDHKYFVTRSKLGNIQIIQKPLKVDGDLS